MIDILNSTIGTEKIEKIRSRMFIFADYSVTEEYEEFMQKILTDPRYELISEEKNFDLQGTLTKIVLYKEIVEEKFNMEGINNE